MQAIAHHLHRCYCFSACSPDRKLSKPGIFISNYARSPLMQLIHAREKKHRLNTGKLVSLVV